jgi:hypothetical protein
VKPLKIILLAAILAALMYPNCMAQWVAEPSAVVGGAFMGFDHKVPYGATKYSWFGFFTAVKTAEVIDGRIWWYNGIQYGNAIYPGAADNWGGNARLVFKGRWPGSYFWISSGWYDHIAEKGTDYESGLTVYAGGSYDLGSGFNLMGEYGWSDRGPAFHSEVKIGVGLDAWDLLKKKK